MVFRVRILWVCGTRVSKGFRALGVELGLGSDQGVGLWGSNGVWSLGFKTLEHFVSIGALNPKP